MKRLCLLLLFTPACAGCVDMGFKLHDAPTGPVTPVSAMTTPIVAGQVAPENARRMAQALWDEMEREELTPPSPNKK